MNTLMKSDPIQRLDDLSDALVAAFADQDWERIGMLDSDCRTLVELAMQEAATDEAALKMRMERLLRLYASLVEACRIQRDQLGADLAQINRGKQGAKVYQLFG